MHQYGFLIVFLGLLELFGATPAREKRQVDANVVNRCREVFGVACDSLPNSGQASTLPPLNTATASTGDQTECECVPYFQCTTNGTMNTDGRRIIDRRISVCPGILDICCKPAELVTGGTSTEGTGTPTPRPTQPPIQIPTRKGCGYRNPGGVTVRITGVDNEAQFAEFPWMVAVLQKAVPPKPQKQYGGSLIHPRAILTAAHTIENVSPSDLIVRAGEWDTQTLSEPIAHQEREVEAVIIHENYNTNNLHNDFAIIILKTPFDLAPNVNTICLPEEMDIFDALRCTATGWGKDKFEEEGKFQAVLKKIELPIVPRDPCQTFFRLTRLGKAFILDPSFICAGGEPGIDTCTGDGGSPLVCPLPNGDNRYVQSGIVAWGLSCGADRTPGAYGNVAKARRWIDSKMAQYNLETSFYVA